MNYFKLEELVDQATFLKYGIGCWQFFDLKALTMLDDFREFIGRPVTCNNWHIHEAYQFRGYRPSWCNVGAKGSAHRKGKAFDLDVKGMTAEEVRQKVMANQDNPLLKNIQRMEGMVNWIHIDTYDPPVGKSKIYIFHP